MKIVRIPEQGKGAFNNGEILENKPIGFPQDGGDLKPYSNLFYWAHAWTDVGSTIGEHPHQGFEIMSFVLEGEIEHYDSQQKGWNTLPKGSAQVIRSRSGISHAEKMNKGSQMLQIWLDPDLNKTIHQSASYDDYLTDAFSVVIESGMALKTYAGEGGPMNLDTPGVEIKEIGMKSGSHTLQVDSEKVHSLFLIHGSVKIDNEHLGKGDFAVLDDQAEILFIADQESSVFIISSPINVNYTTYSQMQFGA